MALAFGALAQRGGGTVQFDFQDAKLRAVIEAVAQFTGRNFLVDPRVKGEVTVVGPERLTPEEAYEAFQSVLAVNGFVTVEGDDVTKIVPQEEGKQRALSLSEGERGGERMVTRVVRVEHMPAQRMVPILRPLIPSYGHLVAYSDTNALIITDHADNVQRLTGIIQRLDQPGATGQVEIVPLVHASAEKMAEVLGKLYRNKKDGDGGQGISVLADGRTNSLIMKADDATREDLKELAKELDSPSDSGGNIHVVYLENADAENVVEVLREVVARKKGGKGGSGTAGVKLHADKQTNAVVVKAPKTTYETIADVVERLDVRRFQVYVEALIVEVSSNKASEFGIQWQATDGLSGDNTGAVGGTKFDIGNSGNSSIQAVAQNPASAGAGLSLGYVNGAINVAGQEVLGLGGLIRALESDTDSNVLSTPNLITMDNEEAEIVVGKNVPFVTGSYTDSGQDNNATNPFQTIERKDVGITLRLTPQITEGSSVKLDIYQEVSSVTRQASNAADIITNKRSLETSVVAENGEMIVLGGLIKTDRSSREQRVPVLSQIPLLGQLFRYQTQQDQKTNLMVFLRPKIIRKHEDMADPTSAKYQFMNRLREKPNKEREEPPPLEEWERFGSQSPSNDGKADKIGRPITEAIGNRPVRTLIGVEGG